MYHFVNSEIFRIWWSEILIFRQRLVLSMSGLGAFYPIRDECDKRSSGRQGQNERKAKLKKQRA